LRVHFYAVLAFPVLTTEPECYVPTFVHNTTPGHVAVEVSANGMDYTASDVVFEYQHSITVTQLEPRHGPINGGTEVLVVGTSFANSSLLHVRFGEGGSGVVSVVRYYNSTHVRCLAPPQLYPGSVVVQVSNNGFARSADFSRGGLLFTYNTPIRHLRFVPKTGSVNGGDDVLVFGKSFINTPQLKCRFGAVIVQATWLGDGELLCTSPPHVPGYYALEVTNNDQDYTHLGVPFWYFVDAVLERITPISGPVPSAGSEVTVYGRNFINMTTLACRFGQQTVPARFRSPTELSCFTPSNVDLTWKDISVQANRMPDPHHGSRLLFPSAHFYPLYLSKLVRVEVTNNGQDFTDSGIVFLYQRDAEVTGVTPNVGQDTGATSLFVSGTHFVNTTSLRCRIGPNVAPATFITSELVLCFAPPFSTMQTNMQLHLQNAVVEVSNNGLDFTSDWAIFQYENSCPSGFYCPAQDRHSQFLCPRGTYCPGTGNFNFTLCPRGAYQPNWGRENCLRCPIGFMCPRAGMHAPQICPAGFVCDVTGIEEAEQPCPPGHFCLEGTATTATTCGHRTMSSKLFPSLTLAERPSTKRLNRREGTQELVLGARNTACFNNETQDFGLAMSPYPARFWMEAHLLPLAPGASFMPIRGRFCLDDSCMRIQEDMALVDSAFDYASSDFALRRPVPCPAGTYCHIGTTMDVTDMKNLSTPQPCFESMYCPQGSQNPAEFKCPSGFYCPFGQKLPCPIGTYCPREAQWDPVPCPPGTYNAMVGQTICTDCPRGYICPGFGRVQPAVCPRGMVCSSTRLSSPNIQCPLGNWCGNGTLTSDPFRNDTSLRPYPCQPGSYCMGGVGFDEVRKGDMAYAQPCVEGFYCQLGSTSPKGSGLCPKGFFCKEGTSVPEPTPQGYFAELLGIVQPAQCRPGYYAPTIETVKCYPCPPGSQCENDGMPEAKICPPGTFRTTVDDSGVMCMGCPQGTWAKKLGTAGYARVHCMPTRRCVSH
jgi:hypothetical protein